MIRVSKLTDYGTVVMSHLARMPESVQSAAEIAATLHLGTPTVSKLLKLLAKQGLVQSARGAQGGYSLARAPSEINMAQIIQAIEGPIAFTECSVTSGLCAQEVSCAIRGNWQRINLAIRDALQAVTLAEMNSAAAPAVNVRRLLDDHRLSQ